MADKGGSSSDETDKNIEMWKIKRVGSASRPVYCITGLYTTPAAAAAPS